MFLPDNIDLRTPEKYVLNIRVKANGFSFSIHEPGVDDGYCYLETSFAKETSLSNNIQRIIFDHNFLTSNFKQTNVIFVSQRYELIPIPFYEKSKVVDMYNFTHHKDVMHILTNEKPVQNNQLVFDIEEPVYLFLYRSLSAPVFYHHSALLMNYFDGKKAKDAGNMFICFHGDFTDIVCFSKKGGILLGHTYKAETEQDLIYYILNIWKNCGFDQLRDKLFIYGYTSNNEIRNVLREYVDDVNDVGNFEQISEFGQRSIDAPLDIAILSV
ncbi:DUF3822 family protein [Dysgonomonas sp. 216]|uniref:DUF3822 family protein n=1 Tax=Dysgonomonas sp. 216 TaxID=2302934 RepID=UPI0013D25C9F|nr:DUF3822 family protein [Dysgonomonas sp. 216]NDW18021.1 DUF3822 family protein [Dysgonomonas sp. 216]